MAEPLGDLVNAIAGVEQTRRGPYVAARVVPVCVLRDSLHMGRAQDQREIDAEYRDTEAALHAATLDDRQQRRLNERQDRYDARNDQRAG